MEPVTIDNPRLWRLVLGIGTDRLHAIATSTVADAGLIYRSIALEPSDNLNRSLEEAVYSSPWLLSDFGRIDIAAYTHRYTLAESGLSQTGKDSCLTLTQIADDDFTPQTTFCDHTDTADVLWAFDSEAARFMARTFRNAPIQHMVTPMLRYFNHQAAQGNGAKIYVHLWGQNPRYIDITAYRNGARLALATSKTIESDIDALYYITGAAKLIDFDVENDRVLVFGDTAERTRLTSLAGRYLRHVMPLIFPSAALRAGRDAFKAPFPLIILPLCE